MAANRCRVTGCNQRSRKLKRINSRKVRVCRAHFNMDVSFQDLKCYPYSKDNPHPNSHTKHYSKELTTPLEPFTFGNSKAATVLADKLSVSNDKRIVRSVGKFFNKFTALVKNTNNLYLLNLIFNDFVSSLRNKNLDVEIKSYLENVIVAYYKKRVKTIW